MALPGNLRDQMDLKKELVWGDPNKGLLENHFTGGALVDNFRASAELVIFPEEIVLKVAFRGCFRFPKDEMPEFVATRGLFAIGIRIRHMNSQYPRKIIFGTRQPEILQSRLRKAGYTAYGLQI